MPRLHQIAAALALLCPFAAGAGVFTYHHENVLGTELELRLAADTQADATAAEIRVLAEIDRLAAILSGHDAGSELRQWQARGGKTQAISHDLRAVLLSADEWRARSGGAFEPGVAAITSAWRGAAQENRAPTPEELRVARAAMESSRWTRPRARPRTHREPPSLHGNYPASSLLWAL